MGRDAMKAGGNLCFQCRKAAAMYNDKLCSREGAAEMLGVSVSSLADYELGITKVIPVDKIVLMAELYNAPELKTWYCSHECPIGRSLPIPDEPLTNIEQITMRLLRCLKTSTVEDTRDTLIEITADGVVDQDEMVDLKEILDYTDELIKAAGQLKVIGTKIMNGR